MNISILGASNVRVLLLVLVLSGALFWPTWSALFMRWYTDGGSYSHGFLVALTSIVLLFKAKLIVAAPSSDRTRIAMTFLVVLFGTLWVLARFANILVVQAILLPIIIYISLAAILGVRRTVPLLFPLAFFYFAIPVWGVFTAPLQAATIAVVGWFLSCVGIPAWIEGTFVHIPSGTFRIASGCAGLHFLVVAMTLGSLFAFLTLSTVRYQLLFVVVVVAASIVMNWIRVATIIVVGFSTEMQHYLVTVDHYYFGWALFLLTLVPVYFFGRWLERAENSPKQSSSESDSSPRVSAPNTWQILVGAAAMCLAPVVGMSLDSISPRNDSSLREVPSVLGEWSWLEVPASHWAPNYAGAAIEITGEYRESRYDITTYINKYGRQTQGYELINSGNYLLDPAMIDVVSSATETMALYSGDVIPTVVVRTVSVDGRRAVVIYWYQVGSKTYTRPLDVKLAELAQRLVGDSGSGLIAFGISCVDDCEVESGVLRRFVRNHGQTVLTALFSSTANMDAGGEQR